MNNQEKIGIGIPLQDSLKFNGKVTASISHEIKNVLAIINENAGLLQDISAMIEEGFVLSPQRLNTIAIKIENQISRGNDIISRLNRFAHSVDTDIIEFNIFDVIEYLSKIYDRIAKQKGLKIILTKPSDEFVIKTNLFNFQYLIWNCFEFIQKNINTENNLEISINFENKEYYINFNLTGVLNLEQSFDKFNENLKNILETINGTLVYNFLEKNIKLIIK